ncbi:hypothetical protein SLS58_002118 [Diplodia intermedia]|uniref:Uncharacterized protein n=1 Tax=Diplodia intermedia TaxID=856260 RepID=A0ABR3U0I2_9PEZI
MPVQVKVPPVDKQIEELKKIFGEDSKYWLPSSYLGGHLPLKQWNPLIITQLRSLAIRKLARTQLHDLIYKKLSKRCSAAGMKHDEVHYDDLKAVYEDLEPNFAAYDAIVAAYGCDTWPEFAPSKPLVSWDTQLLQALARVAFRNGPDSKDAILKVHIPSALQARSAGAHAHMEIGDIQTAEFCFHVDEIKKNWGTIPVKLQDWLPEGTMLHVDNPEEWSAPFLYWLWKISSMTLPHHCHAVKDALLARLKTRQRWDPSKTLLAMSDVKYVFKILEPKLKAIKELRACWGPFHILWLPYHVILKFPQEPLYWDTGILISLSLLAKKHPGPESRRFFIRKMITSMVILKRKDGLVTAGIIDYAAMTFDPKLDIKMGEDYGGSKEFTPSELRLLQLGDAQEVSIRLR